MSPVKIFVLYFLFDSVSQAQLIEQHNNTQRREPTLLPPLEQEHGLGTSATRGITVERTIHHDVAETSCETASCIGRCSGKVVLRNTLSRCYCDLLCKLYQDCCGDFDAQCRKVVEINLQKFYNYKSFVDKVECVPIMNREFIFEAFYMINSCPTDFSSNMDLVYKCSMRRSTILTDEIPMEVGGLVFRNIHCYICNRNLLNIDKSQVKPWTPEISCENKTEAYKIYHEKGVDALMAYAKQSDSKCLTGFYSSNQGKHVCDSRMIKHCDSSSTTDIRKQLIWSNACSNHTAKMYLEKTMSFRNIYCALCNGFENTSISCSHASDFHKQGSEMSMKMPNFRFLMDFTGSGDSTAKVEVIKCPSGMEKGPDETCVMKCDAGGSFTDGNCKSQDNVIKGQANDNILYMLLYFNKYIPWSEFKELLETYNSLIEGTIFKFPEKWHAISCKFHSLCVYGKLELTSSVEDSLIQMIDFNDLYNDKNVGLDHIVVQNILPETDLHCNEGFKMIIKTFNATFFWEDIIKNMDFTSSTPVFSIVISKPLEIIETLTDAEFPLTPDLPGSLQDRTNKTLKSFKCIPALLCPWVKLDSSEYVFTNKSLFIKNIEKEVPKNQYWMENGTMIACASLFKHNITKQDNLPSLEYEIQSWLTLIGQLVSMVSLAFTLLTYILLPKLRTLPGQGIMNLCVSLFLAQLLLQLSPSVKPSRVFCYVFAVGQHLFWLCSFCWMTSLAFNIARTFGGSSLAKGGEPSLRPYLVLSYVCPLLFIFACVAVDLSDHYNIGYAKGTDSCWIQNLKARLYFFAVPLGTLLLINLILFLISVIGLFRATRAAKKVKSSKEGRRADRKLLFAYIKLCSIMGFTWIFGFLANVNRYLWYLFIILNTLQGFFIFISFVCSKRVIGMLGTKLGITCLIPPEITNTGSTNVTSTSATQSATQK